MQKFEKVKYTRPFELLFLMVSSIILFLVIILLLDSFIKVGNLEFILTLSISVIYFMIIKNYFIIKEADFELTKNQLRWENKSIEFENIEYYKIHWLKGAGIKFKLKNGKIIRISSNDFFCDSEKFVDLCRKIETNLGKFNHNKVLRKYSFFETKIGYYFIIIMSILLVLALIIKIFRKDEINFVNLGLILSSLMTIWSGVKWNRK